MLSAEEFINTLVHEAEYDPAKRREYYLRTRELKGRAPGAIKTAVPRPGGTTPPPKKAVPKPAVKSKYAEVEARVEALKARLETLRKALRELVEQAQQRAGKDPKDTKKPGEAKKPDKQPEKLTPAQQAAKEKADKEYYEKNKGKILADQVKELETKIKSIQEKIKKMRAEAAKPVKKPAKKAGSVGAASKR